LTYLTINNGSSSVYDLFTAYTYNAQYMVRTMQQFDLSDGLAAGLIPSSEFSGSSAYDTVTPLRVNYTYQQGNLLTQKTAGGNQETFTWNNRNVLTQVVTENSSGTVIQSVNYTYNAANQRISKIVTNGSGTVVANQRYVYDGSNLLAVLNVNPATGVPTVAQRFMMHDAGVLAQENASGTGQAGAVSWAITDNTGSVVDVVANGSGNAILGAICNLGNNWSFNIQLSGSDSFPTGQPGGGISWGLVHKQSGLFPS
jgi:YD repeat-containing protein